MAAPETDSTTAGTPAEEDRQVAAYIDSADWTRRLDEARRRRKDVLAARAGGGERSPLKPEARISRGSAPPPLPPRLRERLGASRPASAPEVPVSGTGRRAFRAGSGAALSVATIALLLAGLVLAGGLFLRHGMEAGDAPRLAAGGGSATAPETPPARSSDGPPAGRRTGSRGGVGETGGALDGRRVTIVAGAAPAELVARLRAAGARSLAVRATPFRTERTTVNYFHRSDAEAARRLSGELGGAAVDLTGFRPSPPAGTLEVRPGAG